MYDNKSKKYNKIINQKNSHKFLQNIEPQIGKIYLLKGGITYYSNS